MKKVMFVCQSLANGGAERVVSVLSEAMKDKYQVYILTLGSNASAYPVSKNVKVIAPNINKKGFAQKRARIKTIKKTIIEYGIDIIIAFSHYNAMYSVLAARGMKNVRVIGSERNDPAQLADRKFLNWYRNRLYRKLDCLVCQTEDAKNYFPEEIQKKSVIILNPLKKDLPARFEGKREKRIVSFSRLEKQKNIPMLIDAFEMLHKECPEYRLDIYGNGSEKDSILEYLKQKGMTDCVKISPFQKNIHEIVLRATAFALSSDYEGLSNSMLEAMAIGLPTVVTDCPCGGARMVIKDGENGLLVPVGDSKTMYKKLKYLIDNPEVAEKISQAGTLLRTELSMEEISKQWMNTL